MGIVFDILGRLFDFLINTVLPNVKPLVENTLLPMAGKVLEGILQ